MTWQPERIEDSGTALALAVIAEAMADRYGRRWLRSDLARPWCWLAKVEWSAVVRRANQIDGYLSVERVA